jgi:hypothetical protein
MFRRSTRWIWTGRAIFAVVATATVVYLANVTLSRADMIASCISAILALGALVAPYLFPRPSTSEDTLQPWSDSAEHTGEAVATGGGQAITGVMAGGSARPARVSNSGPARADGPGSVANSGVLRQPDGRQ